MESLLNLLLLNTLQEIQSFLGDLNYFFRLIEDFAIHAEMFQEVHEADFCEIKLSQSATNEETRGWRKGSIEGSCDRA